jgi:hypothetical protein
VRRLLLAVLILGVCAAPARAAFPGQDLLLLSAGAGGAAPNGPARHAAISQDNRLSRLAAFESDATDLVVGAGPATNVFVVRRAPGRSAATDVGVDPSRRPDADGMQDIQLSTPFDRRLVASDGAAAPSSDPKTSPHGNSIVFERGGQVWLNHVGAR